MPRKSTKKRMTEAEIKAVQVIYTTKRLLESAQKILLTASIISRDGLSKKQKEYIKSEIKKDGEFKIDIKNDVKVIESCAKNTLRNLIDRETGE